MADKKGAPDEPKSNLPFAVSKLRGFVKRIESLVEARRASGADIREVYKEAKAAGFNTKTLRSVVKTRGADQATLAEERDLQRSYEQALGIFE